MVIPISTNELMLFFIYQMPRGYKAVKASDLYADRSVFKLKRFRFGWWER